MIVTDEALTVPMPPPRPSWWRFMARLRWRRAMVAWALHVTERDRAANQRASDTAFKASGARMARLKAKVERVSDAKQRDIDVMNHIGLKPADRYKEKP